MEDKKYNCPACGSENIRKNGFILKRNKKVQRYQCNSCSLNYTGETIDESIESMLIETMRLMDTLSISKYEKEIDLVDGTKRKMVFTVRSENGNTEEKGN